MGMLLGATVYVFSIILAVFLIGLALGSAAGSWLLRAMPGARNARLALGWCQVLLTAGIAWTACMIADSLPYWPINPLLTTSPWFTFQLDMARCLWAILPPTLLWGASFPLALRRRGRARRGPRPRGGRRLRRQHARRHRRRAAGQPDADPLDRHAADRSACCCCSPPPARCSLLVPYVREHRSKPAGRRRWRLSMLVRGCWLAACIDPVPGKLIAYGRRMAVNPGHVQDALHRRGPQFLGGHHAAGTTAPSKSTSTATWRPPPSLTI